MNEEPVGRRQALQRAGLIAGGTLLVSNAVASPASAADDLGVGPLGAWLIERVDPALNQTHIGVGSFSVGGTIHYEDTFPAGPVWIGAWTAGPGRTYRFEMWTALPPDPVSGLPAVRARATASGTFTRRTLANPYVVTLFDAASGAEVFRFEGSAKGTRIEL